MRKTSAFVAGAAWLALGGSATPPVLALDYDQARALAASARATARESQVTPEVEAPLRRGVAECMGGPQGAPCRAVLRFTLGGLAKERAEQEPAERTRWLREAIAEYEAILVEASDHAPTLQSLADIYLRLGDTGRAEAVLVDALRKHPEQETLAMMLGDFYRKAKRWDDAFRAYTLATASNSAAELPRRRMVETYVELLPERLADFWKFLGEIESTFPSTAESGYRAIISRTYAPDRVAAEAALVRLVAVLAGARRLTRESLDALPPSWTPLVELGRYVEAPHQTPPAGWWFNPIEHRHVLAEAALGLGNQAALASDPVAAASRWEVGLRFAPDYDEYVFGRLKGFRVMRLDLQTALALHYFKFPSLDPGEAKFNAVIQDLFRTKAGAYAADDLPGIQRHHTILGTIFAQKKAWRPGRIDGAMFQLEHALETAARRDRREGTYQPLPELRAQFAEGLVATGMLDRARAIYVDAAQAYLDTDGLGAARQMLQQAGARARGGQASEQARIAQLGGILSTREAIALAAGAKLDPVSAAYSFKPDGPHAWMFGRALGPLPKDFIERQRFKALSDLAERAHTAGQSKVSEELALRAFKTAVEDVRHLNGAADVVRLERIRKQATQQKVLDARPLTLERAETPITRSPKTWVLTDTSAGQPAYVRVEQDDLLAARIVGELSRDPVAERPDFRVSRGQVMLPPGDKTEAVKPRIEGLLGVTGVVIKPSLPAAVPKK